MFLLPLCLILMGCGGAPASKADHIKQVQQAIAQAGGEAKILAESRILFPRCLTKIWSMPGVGPEDYCFDGLPGIKSLGDVFYYESSQIRIRVHNSHQDTYFICLLDPDKPHPENFERITGNVGFIKP
ncbi:MAG: hypothetical protein JWR26_1653 [Pedosphaera sp.]|nr:hypothetical protein [Pedosphaera sp.]